MARRLALAALALGPPVALVCLLVSVPGGPTVFALLAALLPPALIALAAGRGRPLGPLGPALLLLVLLLGGGVGGLLWLRGSVGAAPWIGGLPAAAALLLWGLWALPLALTCLAHGLGFRRSGAGETELEALRRRFPRRGSGGAEER